MIVKEKTVNGNKVKVDDSCVVTDVENILENLSRIASNAYTEQLKSQENKSVG